ncbi:hypothetical protein [Cryobacterium serini]|uniref:Uncharacterized protein n=1 Tax=Cryobacterium serini TaxID=1259201 RepID=A0A4R9BK22_9MICO|nr:hypothetical protein [Cryobacterium serini]TFD86084.1 hypothetical protein E3T51_13165 [Cryobacterium serini]
MSFDREAQDLTHPLHVDALRDYRPLGGQVHIAGSARFDGVRVVVSSVSGDNLVVVIGELPINGVQNRDFLDPTYRDSRSPLMVGEVDFSKLDQFWLTRTSTWDVIDENTPLPGLLTTIDGIDFGVADSGGIVSLAGVPQLQLVWLGGGEPQGEGEWLSDGYGAFTRLVRRDQVPGLRHVEWTAIWRDITVKVAGIRGERAHIFVEKGGVPTVEHPEIRHGANAKSGWSAVVGRAELSLRSWTSTERPVGQGAVIGCVGLVRGRTGVVLLPASRDEQVAGIIVRRNLGETVTDDFVIHAMVNGRNAPVEWRAVVAEANVTCPRRIEATVEWRGKRQPLDGLNEPAGVAYLPGHGVPLDEVSTLEYTVGPVALSELPPVDWEISNLRGA